MGGGGWGNQRRKLTVAQSPLTNAKQKTGGDARHEKETVEWDRVCKTSHSNVQRAAPFKGDRTYFRGLEATQCATRFSLCPRGSPVKTAFNSSQFSDFRGGGTKSRGRPASGVRRNRAKLGMAFCGFVGGKMKGELFVFCRRTTKARIRKPRSLAASQEPRGFL